MTGIHVIITQLSTTTADEMYDNEELPIMERILMSYSKHHGVLVKPHHFVRIFICANGLQPK
jgi:hypothetical protein